MDITCIISGGNGPDDSSLERICKSATSIIAADSGYDRCRKLHISCDLVVGDFDSTGFASDFTGEDKGSIKSRQESRSVPEVMRFEKDKDYSDTELAISQAIKRGEGLRLLLGGGGGRMDHLLANLLLFEGDNSTHYWHSGDSEIAFLDGTSENPWKDMTGVSLPVGSNVSVFPIGAGPHKILSQGLQWSLDDLSWNAVKISLSNRTLSSTIQLTVLQGRFLCMVPVQHSLPLYSYLTSGVGHGSKERP